MVQPGETIMVLIVLAQACIRPWLFTGREEARVSGKFKGRDCGQPTIPGGHCHFVLLTWLRGISMS